MEISMTNIKQVTHKKQPKKKPILTKNFDLRPKVNTILTFWNKPGVSKPVCEPWRLSLSVHLIS